MKGKLGQEAGSHRRLEVVVHTQELQQRQAMPNVTRRQVLDTLAAVVTACQVVRDMLHHLVAARRVPSLHLLQSHTLAQHNCVFFDLQHLLQEVLEGHLVRATNFVGPLAGCDRIVPAEVARNLADLGRDNPDVGLP